MAENENGKPKAVEREARRLQRLGKLRLIQPPPEKIATPIHFDSPPKDAA